MQTMKHGGGLLMRWANSATSGTENLQHVDNKIDSSMFQEIVGENVMPPVRKSKHGFL